LNLLGRKRALVVNAAGFMDEASLAGENHLVLLDDGKINSFTLHPEEVGLSTYTNEEIRGGDAKRNAEILLSVLQHEQSPYLDTVLLNAGLGLYANGKTTDIKDGIDIARESIASVASFDRLNKLVHYNISLTSEAI